MGEFMDFLKESKITIGVGDVGSDYFKAKALLELMRCEQFLEDAESVTPKTYDLVPINEGY